MSADASSIEMGHAGKSKRGREALVVWLPIIAGLCVLYVPTLMDLFRGIWTNDEQAHGPIVLAGGCWLIIRKWRELNQIDQRAGARAAGWTVFLIGLVLYVLGRSQAIIQFELGSVIWILTGLALIMFGPAGLRKLWFPLFFLLFMIPLPGIFVQTMTIPLKTAVSFVAEEVLHFLNYPIGRSGVILNVGPYQLLVADACAGMHTLFTLEALGLLYMNLMGHTSLGRNIALAVLIFPISFCANVIRVIILVLITFHFGDAAGQGFLHGFAGMALFLTTLLLIMGTDSILGKLFRERVSSAG